ncbi:hypothetical protein L484_009981 [Morus notabilis]|uniref:Uncharacterized protein n=1 Tax=Morus notabilis TaxID=981085 RepID=W9STT8_9ROSA|nr:hypothetical protein L484_009981 [Morus notabilis]
MARKLGGNTWSISVLKNSKTAFPCIWGFHVARPPRGVKWAGPSMDGPTQSVHGRPDPARNSA